MPAFWAWFVAAGTIAFVIWCVWLISWAGKQGPQNKEDEDLVGHVWDGDLEEWNNPAPKWWLYLYFITIAWGAVYLISYPGLGITEGLLNWTQEGQYEEEMQAAEARYEPIYERFAAMEFAERVADPEALELGRSLFANYCTTCHGSDVRRAWRARLSESHRQRLAVGQLGRQHRRDHYAWAQWHHDLVGGRPWQRRGHR